MRRLVICLVVGLALVAAGRRLRTPADDLIVAAQSAYARGDFATSAALYGRAGSSPAVAHNRAAALYRQGHFADAAEVYGQSGGDDRRDARAAYNRGTCLLQLGAPEGESVKPDFVLRAVEQYRACLERESRLPADSSLFADARHNLELAKLLLNPSDQERPEDECPS